MSMVDQIVPAEYKPKGPGRPTKYRDEYAAWAEKFAKLGATLQEMAESFEVTLSTLNEWKSSIPAFSDAIARGRSFADANMANSLYHRGLGYSHPAVKIFCTKDGQIVEGHYTEHYPPDTMAASLWLRNRRPDLWRDKQEHDVTVTGKLARLDDEERAARALELVRGMLGKDQAPAIEGQAIDVTPASDDSAK